MIFIRDNSMPDINIVQLEMAEDKKDKFSKKDKCVAATNKYCRIII